MNIVDRLRRVGVDVEPKTVKIGFLGVDSNAFALLAHWRRAAKSQGWTQEEIDSVMKEATSVDYNHLLQTLIRHSR